MSSSTITVEFKTYKNYCPCCHQKLKKAKVSELKTMDFSKETALSWAPWKEVVEEYPEDLECIVPEFVRETIHFFATDIYENVIVEDSEIEKVKSWILNDVV